MILALAAPREGLHVRDGAVRVAGVECKLLVAV